MPSYTRVAGGNVEPMHAVALGTGGRVTQAGSAVQVYGVSGQSTRNAPYGALDDGFHAIAGEDCLVHGPPEKDVSLVLGGTVAIGAFIVSDVNGEGTASTTDRDDVFAIAMQAGSAGDIIKVQLIIMERSTA